VGTEILTALRLCPEVLLGKTAVTNGTDTVVEPSSSRIHVIPDMSKTQFVPDKKLCITFVSFETDLDLDSIWAGLFHQDEPTAQMCFQGKCVRTGTKHFSGNTVTWNEEKCMDVMHSHLFGDGAGSLAFVVKEWDLSGYNQQYTQQQLWQLPETCSEKCEKTFAAMPIPPSLQKDGSIAKLVVKLKFKDLGRRITSTNEAREHLACGSRQSAVATTLGLGGMWSGFTYPNVYDEGKGKGEEVDAPAEVPVIRPKDPELTCVPVEHFPVDDDNKTDDLLSFAPGLGCKFNLMSVMFGVLLALRF